jgi:hypothetical protein
LRQFLDVPQLECRVIRLLRDGRGVVNSYMKHTGSTVRQATLEWLRSHRAAERVLSKVDAKRVATVKYEHLCGEPERTLHRLFDFLDLAPPSTESETATSQLHILGNEMRLGANTLRNADEKWRRELRPSDLHEFESLAGRRNRGWGYL